MRSKISKILITGGAGFIGSSCVRQLARNLTLPESPLIVVDKLTYAGDLKRLEPVKGRFKFHKTDICDKAGMERIFQKERPEVLIHFAAQTHVDRSIKDPAPFLDTNIMGTKVLLDNAIKFNIKKVLHISTDEVYGEIKKGKFTEESPLAPNSPYSASKAATDLLINSYMRTYKLPAVIIRPCNNYGPWQYPEKLIPLAMLQALKNEKIPIYADGKNVREWLYVEDCAEGIIRVLKKGRTGEIYNLGSNVERENLEVAKEVLENLGLSQKLIKFVKDRPGHDKRYRLNSAKVYRETGWRPRFSFAAGLKITVLWGIRHRDWLLSKGKGKL